MRVRYRLRQAFAARREWGVALFVTGLAVFLYVTPSWVWYAIIGIALMGGGWYLFQHK